MRAADGLALAIEGCAEGVMGLVRWPDRPEVEPGEDILVGALYRYRAGRQDASREREASRVLEDLGGEREAQGESGGERRDPEEISGENFRAHSRKRVWRSRDTVGPPCASDRFVEARWPDSPR